MAANTTTDRKAPAPGTAAYARAQHLNAVNAAVENRIGEAQQALLGALHYFGDDMAKETKDRIRNALAELSGC